jgi:hypothetical protein
MSGMTLLDAVIKRQGLRAPRDHTQGDHGGNSRTAGSSRTPTRGTPSGR